MDNLGKKQRKTRRSKKQEEEAQCQRQGFKMVVAKLVDLALYK